MSEVTTTDLYEVTMAMSYLREGMHAQATFSPFVRDLPPDRGFLVAAAWNPRSTISPASLSVRKMYRNSPRPFTGRSGILSRYWAWDSTVRSVRSQKGDSCSPMNHCWK